MEAEIQPKRYPHYKVPLFLTDGHKTYTVCRQCKEVKGVTFQDNHYDGKRDKTEKVNCSQKRAFHTGQIGHKFSLLVAHT